MTNRTSVPVYSKPEINFFQVEAAAFLSTSPSNAQLPEFTWDDTDGDAF